MKFKSWGQFSKCSAGASISEIYFKYDRDTLPHAEIIQDVGLVWVVNCGYFCGVI